MTCCSYFSIFFINFFWLSLLLRNLIEDIEELLDIIDRNINFDVTLALNAGTRLIVAIGFPHFNEVVRMLLGGLARFAEIEIRTFCASVPDPHYAAIATITDDVIMDNFLFLLQLCVLTRWLVVAH